MSVVLLEAGVAAVAAVTGATAGVGKKAAGGDICVLMPDTATSIRWVHYDAPALKAAFANASSDIYVRTRATSHGVARLRRRVEDCGFAS